MRPFHYFCDCCGHLLQREDYIEGCWEYVCPECGFHYVHDSDVLDVEIQLEAFELEVA